MGSMEGELRDRGVDRDFIEVVVLRSASEDEGG